MTGTAAPKHPSPFRGSAFRIYWFGGLCSNSGTWLHTVTSSVLMFDLTGSPFMVGVLNFANFIPILLFSLVGGVVSDRVDRTRMVVVVSAASVAVSATLAALAFSGRLGPVTLIVVSFLLGSGYAFAKPAISAMLPALVDRGALAQASAVNTLQFTLGQVLGSTLSALILAVSQPWVAFSVNAVTYVAPIVSMTMLRAVVVQQRAGKASGWASLREGFAFVAGRGGLLGFVFAIVFTNGIVEALRTLSPALTERSLGLGSEDAGLLVGAVGAGSALGAMMFGRLSRRFSRARIVQLGYVMQIVGVSLLSIAPTLPLAMAAAVLIGNGFALIIPLLNTAMHERSTDEMRGRVMAAFAMAHLGLRPLSALLAGALASWLGIRAALVLFVLSALAGLLTLRGGVRVEPPD